MTDSTGGGKGMAIAAMVLGIAAFFPGCCLAGYYLNFVIAVIAVILGVMAMNGPGRGMAITGIILGIVSIVLYIAAMLMGTNLADYLQDKMDEQKAVQQEEGDPQDAGDPDTAGE